MIRKLRAKEVREKYTEKVVFEWVIDTKRHYEMNTKRIVQYRDVSFLLPGLWELGIRVVSSFLGTHSDLL